MIAVAVMLYWHKLSFTPCSNFSIWNLPEVCSLYVREISAKKKKKKKNWLKGAHARVIILSTNFRIKVNEKLVLALILVIFIIEFFSVLYCGPHLEQQVIGAERKFNGMSWWLNLHTTWALGQYNVAILFVLFYSLSSTTHDRQMLVITSAEHRFDHWQSVEKKKGIWSLHYLARDQCWQMPRTSDCCHLSTMSSCAT